MDERKTKKRKDAAIESIRACVLSLFTSAIILTIAGSVLGAISTNLVLSQLGTLVGRGAVISFILVLFVLPALLMIFDRLIEKTTAKTKFYKEEFRHEPK